MKISLFFSFLLWLLPTFALPAQNGPATRTRAPYIEVVVASNKVWLLPEETPLTVVKAQVLDTDNRVLIEKEFRASTEAWWIDITDLPAGQYQLRFATGQREYFEKRSRKRTL